MNTKEALNELEDILKKMVSTTHSRRAFLASVPLLMAACATQRHRQREGDNTGQQTEMSVSDEQRMTQEVLPQMQKDYPPAQDPELQNYISGLGKKLVTANGLEGNPYHYNFTVVDAPYVNAFALPAGTVFVTAPLMGMAQNEAELAGVVGHEIGHVKSRHTAERMDRAKKEQKNTWLYAVGGGLLGAGAGFGLGKLLCKKEDTACLAKASAIGAAAGAGAGFLIQKYAFMANSREDEMEADRIGFRTSVRAGYDKNHAGSFYSKLLQMEQQAKRNHSAVNSAIADAMSTHPPSQERVAQMEELALSTTQTNGVVSSKEFDNARTKAQGLAKAHKKS